MLIRKTHSNKVYGQGKMKKTVTLLLIICVAVLSLCACGASRVTDNKSQDERYPFISQAVKDNWKADIISTLESSDVYGDREYGGLGVALMDIDLDNVPELFDIYSGGSMGNVFIVIYDISTGQEILSYNAPHGDDWNTISLCVYASDSGELLTVGEGDIRPDVYYHTVYSLTSKLKVDWLFAEATEQDEHLIGNYDTVEYWCGYEAKMEEYEAKKQSFYASHTKISQTQLQIVYWDDITDESKQATVESMATALLSTSQQFVDIEKYRLEK